MRLENEDNSNKEPYRANRGLINGNGFTNGLGSDNTPLNGKGLVNGNGLTNGNGMGTRKYSRIPLIKSKKFRNRIIGVMLAITLIVAPLFIYVVDFSDTPSGILIDGNFRDWENQDNYVDSADDVDNPNINIVEYNLKQNGNDVNVYVEVEGDVLKGTDAKVTDTLNIFIDSDTDPSTGYSVNGLGADYMLETQGRSGRIIKSNVKIFDPTYRTMDRETREQNDWNGWTDLQNGKVECARNKLETRIQLYDTHNTEIEISDNVFACIRLADSSGNEDYSDTIISDVKGSLIAKQTPLVDNVISDDQTDLLALELRAVGGDVTIDRINFEHIGNGELVTDQLPMTITEDSTARFTVSLDTTQSLYGDSESVRATRIITRDNVPVRLTGDRAAGYIKAVPTVIRIDGAFADWDNVPAGIDELNEESVNNNPNIDLVEHKNINQNDKVSFYMKVDGSMMDGAEVLTRPMVWQKGETIDDNDEDRTTDNALTPLPAKIGDDAAYIFIDTDRDFRTGYRSVEMDIGADYMIEITGQDGEVLSRTLYTYSQTSINTRVWNWEEQQNEVLAATDSTQLEAQINVNALRGSNDEGVDLYYMMTDWNGNSDSSGEPISIRLTPADNIVFSGHMTGRGPQATITYGDAAIDANWTGIGVDINDANDVGPPNGGDIIEVKVCDNYTANGGNISNTWINFLVDMQGGPISENVFIYIDTNFDNQADWCLSLDINIGGFFFVGLLHQWNGTNWTTLGPTPFDWPAVGATDQFEVGLNLSKIGNITSFQYNVTTNPGTAALLADIPGTGPTHDEAPGGAGFSTYVVIPEFPMLMIPVMSAFLMVFILYRKRRKSNRFKKEVV
jgi:hypothetical protein